jgi:tetratricopeptide (TPR) repeat protein
MKGFSHNFSAVAGRVLLAAALSAGVAHARGLTETQLSRLDPKAEATSILLQTIKELLKNEQLEEAIPFLQETVVRLEGDADRKARQTLAFSVYQLGDVYMKLGEYELAAKYFIQFGDSFKRDPSYFSSRILAAQCLSLLRQWPQVEEQISILLSDERTLPDDIRLSARQVLSESLYQQQKWAAAVPPLVAVFRGTNKDDVRAGTAVMLVTCYVRLNDFENLFKFLPYCDDAARHDVGLNVALLEGGDAHYNAGEYQKALLLYRLVLLHEDLVVHYEERMETIKANTKPFVPGGSVSMTQYKEMLRQRQQEYMRLEQHLSVIRNFPDYDMDVALRLAQCYGDLDRNWPAHAIYQRIYTENPTNALAEQARFSSFSVMLSEREWATALAEGYEYVDLLPQGEFIDDVTLNLMRVHMHQNRFDLAYEIGSKGLELSPDHKYIDQITHLLGYIRFTQFDYAEALERFSTVLDRWPDSSYYEASEYWRAMTLLFKGDFAEAVEAFKGYLANTKYDVRTYEEDASYRLGVAEYGAEQFAESEETFRAFVDRWPDSPLVSEAYAMLGDLRAAEGDLEVALGFYRTAREKARNMSQVNYPVFQSAKVLELQKKYDEIMDLMTGYLDEWEEKGDIANAVNWQGKARKAQGRYPDALEAYLAAIDRFGNKAELTGVDMIVNEIINDYTGEEWITFRGMTADQIDRHLAQSVNDRRKTLELRYKTLYAHLVKGEARAFYVDSVVRSRNVPAAGPLTLVLIAREGVKRKDYGIVHEAYDRFMSTFPVSANMLYVMNANLDALVEEGNYDDALALSEEILLKFGYSPSVGWARKRRGDAYRIQGKHELAIEAYKEVLAIREWRGPLTPEALYWTGICKMELGHVEEAFAYFQRIYVLYEDYTEWVAPAYAKSVECLRLIGGRSEDIINTYKEMAANEKVAATPEGKEAQRRLKLLLPEEETL